MSTLVLTKGDVEQLVDMPLVLEAVEGAFRDFARGVARMPPKVYLDLEKGDLRAMPAFVPGGAGIKWVNSHPGNPGVGLPTVMAVLIYNDPDTGYPLAVMDATFSTNMRTGAAGGVAARYLARRDSRVVGVVGCGAQARTQLMALGCVRDVEKVRLYDVRGEAAHALANDRPIEAEYVVCDSVEECVRGADVVITVTPVRSPVVMDEWIGDGTHINAMGADAPGKEELDPQILRRAKIVVDSWDQASHSGEINVPLKNGVIGRENVWAEIGEVVAGLRPGREHDSEVTVFDSTGLAIQDMAVAKIIYERAREHGLGLEVSLF